MRWYIKENKKKIASHDFEGHRDDVEMSGEAVSGIIGYSVENGELSVDRFLVYPMFRTHPDVTQSSLRVKYNEPLIDFGKKESFCEVEFDGVLCIKTVIDEKIHITRRFYPSTALPVFYEDIEIYNDGDKPLKVDFQPQKRINTCLGCRGYIYTEIIADKDFLKLAPSEQGKIRFGFYSRFANEENELEENPLEKRYERVEALRGVCDLTTGNDVIDTMFAFAKVRAGESIFKTSAGRVHSPGGTNYYAAIWCNDQSEYSTPWFAFTGDKILCEAAENAISWFEPYMNDEFLPIPSSIISEATDFWNGAGDRGDAAMFLYGNSRYFLTSGIMPDESQLKMLDWCAEYIKRKITDEGVVFSDTDELENRLSSGVNLNTSSLAFGGFSHYARILEKMGNDKKAEEMLCLKETIRKGIKEYFEGNVGGYETYRYHKGCEQIRAWTCLPVYMGINDRGDETLRAIDETLWREGGLATTQGEQIMWDRSTLYYISSLFRGGKTEKAMERLKEYSEIRLLGERVPYAVEAYPEYNMRHLSGESALFCRVITDGIFGIHLDGESPRVKCSLPDELENIEIHRIFLDGEYKNIKVSRSNDGTSFVTLEKWQDAKMK